MRTTLVVVAAVLLVAALGCGAGRVPSTHSTAAPDVAGGITLKAIPGGALPSAGADDLTLSVAERNGFTVATVGLAKPIRAVAAYAELRFDRSAYRVMNVRALSPQDFTRLTLSVVGEGRVALGIAGVRGRAMGFAQGALWEVVLTADYAGGKRVSGVPRGASGVIPVVNTQTNADGTVEIGWQERNPGDYDNSGAVDIADLTPLAQHFGEKVSAHPNDAIMDGDGDGEVGIGDLGPLAANYGDDVGGYNVYHVEELSWSFTVTGRLPNAGSGFNTVDRPASPGPTFVEYTYHDSVPPTANRFVYDVRPVGQAGGEGPSCFRVVALLSTAVKTMASADMHILTPFGYSATVPAGAVPDGTAVTVRTVPPAEILATSPGGSLIAGMEISAPVAMFTSPVAIALPIPLGVKTVSATGPATLTLYKYDPVAQALTDSGLANHSVDENFYEASIGAPGIYCVYGAMAVDTLPPVWSGASGVDHVTLAGANAVTVYFGTATDDSPPVTYNIYYSTQTPVDFGIATKVMAPSSPFTITDIEGLSIPYYFVVRAQDKFGNEDSNTHETSLVVPRPDDDIYITSYAAEYHVGDTVTIIVNCKRNANPLALLSSVRVTWDGSLVTLKTINTQAGSFFAPFTGTPFPSPYLPQPGPPPFVDTNLIYIGGTYEAPPLTSGDLFGILFKANAPGLATFTIPDEPPPMSSHSYYQSLDNSAHNWTYHQGVTVRILP